MARELTVAAVQMYCNRSGAENLAAAEEWKNQNGGDFIESRKGVDKKCADYCLCCTKCDFWKSLQEVANGES